MKNLQFRKVVCDANVNRGSEKGILCANKKVTFYVGNFSLSMCYNSFVIQSITVIIFLLAMNQATLHKYIKSNYDTLKTLKEPR